MRRTILNLLPTFAVFLVISCHGDGTTGPYLIKSWTSDFFGSVYDNQGMPVANVGVHFIPHFSGEWNSWGLAKTTPSVSIVYNIPHSGIVTLKIYRHGTDEVMATPVDHQQLDEGYYNAPIEGSLWTNGVYYYILTLDGVVIDNRNLLFLPAPTTAYASYLETTTGLAVTDADGKFNLPHSVFGVGTTFTRTDETAEVPETYSITDTLDLVLIKSGYQIFIQQVVVDTLHSTNGTYRLVPAMIR